MFVWLDSFPFDCFAKNYNFFKAMHKIFYGGYKDKR